MGMLKEFKEFAMRGSVVDLAVGVIIGGAFGKIVTSAVNDIIMPPIGRAMGNVNFSDLFINLDSSKGPFKSLADAKAAGAAVLAYGSFINTVIDFLIVALCIFVAVKAMNSLQRKEAAAPTPAPSTKLCEYCVSEIPIKATRCPHCTSQVK
jgi:large conductance mechanosensitive channel